MAHTLESFPERLQRKYDKFIDGQVWFIPNDELKANGTCMQSAIRGRAACFGLSVRASQRKEAEGLTIQAFKPEQT